jgi:hypothetical protein
MLLGLIEPTRFGGDHCEIAEAVDACSVITDEFGQLHGRAE